MHLFFLFTDAVPIVTYILGPKTPEELPGYENIDLSAGGELCENITYLGKEDCRCNDL